MLIYFVNALGFFICFAKKQVFFPAFIFKADVYILILIGKEFSWH